MLLPILIASHVPSLLHFVPPASPPLQGTRSTSQTTAEIAEDVEVLRRLLVEAIEPARERRVTLDTNGLDYLMTTDSILTYYAGGERVSGSRGYHVSGSGAFYSIDVRLPVVAAAESEAPTNGDEPREDEWERARRAVREGDEPRSHLALGYDAEGEAKRPQRLAIDHGARAEVVDAMLATLAKHGARLRGLESGDAIVVALHVEGSGSDSASTSGSYQRMLLGNVLETAKDGALWRSLAAQRAPAERVVIRIPFEALRATGGSTAEVRRAAEVHQY